MADFQFRVELDTLSKSHQAIANYVIGSLQQIPYCTDEDIARQAGVSTATVSRFWRAVGYANLKAFKLELLQAGLSTPARKMKQILHKVEHDEADILGEMIGVASSNLSGTGKRVDRRQFDLAIETIHRARKLYLYGGGPSASVAELMAYRLSRIGVDVIRMAVSGRELLETMVHAGSGDVLFLFGFVKRTPELTVLLQHAKEAGCVTVLVTDLLVSDMLAQSDCKLQIDRGEWDGFHSMTAPIALTEALVVGVTKLRGREAMEKLERLHALRKRYASHLPK
ncbi:MurR/RpiR family transcriptional regulator [Paenibacillus nanensis]|uniref:MurR/RpiR family transcriptional regulator n=1 Tax=Paenibacillus nanensis TaxID=393251 RepID=UPI0013C35C59|nr:MurR/RpiR family transcriptional regulator [Paenibacillus nanensis]